MQKNAQQTVFKWVSFGLLCLTYVFLLITFLLATTVGLAKPSIFSNDSNIGLWNLTNFTYSQYSITYDWEINSNGIAIIVFLILSLGTLISSLVINTKCQNKIKNIYQILACAFVLLISILALAAKPISSYTYTSDTNKISISFLINEVVSDTSAAGYKLEYSEFGWIVVVLAILIGLAYAGAVTGSLLTFFRGSKKQVASSNLNSK